MLELEADLGVKHMMLALKAYKELQGHGSFHTDFKGRPGMSGNICQDQEPCRQPQRVMCEAVGVKPKMQWQFKQGGDVRNVELPLRKAAGSEQS
jgi:hypothetical protein